MAWGWLGTSSFLLVIAAVVTYVAMTRFRGSRFEPIGAEKMASDVLAQDTTSTEKYDRYPSSEDTASQPSKTGRLAIFGAGSLSLLLGLLFIAIAAFTHVTWVVPACFMIVGFGALASLRALAVRDQRAKNGHLVADSAETSSDDEFDNENRSVASAAAQSPAVETASVAPRVLKAKPVAASVKSLRYARTHRDFERYEKPADDTHRSSVASHNVAVAPATDHRALQVEDSSWAPVEVPRPLYLDAEEHFHHIEPVELPSEVQAHSKTLSEAASRSVRLDLDDVLKRRRA